MTQFDRLVDRQIRSLVEYEVRHRKANNFGIGGVLCSLFFFGHPIFAAIEYWYSVKERCGMSIMIGRKKYYRLYDSYKLFDGEEKKPNILPPAGMGGTGGPRPRRE